MKYSLIIATLGRKKELLELIESIKNSDYEISNLEIIIVDQNEKGFLDKELSKFENLNIKIIVVSAREHERQKVDALDKGADDYLTKPFSIPELLARIRVAFRNKSDNQDKSENIEFYEFNGLKVDYEKRQVLVDNVEIKLTPIEYKLVELLSKHSGRVLTHKFLIKETWGTYLESDNQTLRVFMANIRKKIESDTTNPKYIVTEVGVGYRLKSE